MSYCLLSVFYLSINCQRRSESWNWANLILSNLKFCRWDSGGRGVWERPLSDDMIEGERAVRERREEWLKYETKTNILSKYSHNNTKKTLSHPLINTHSHNSLSHSFFLHFHSNLQSLLNISSHMTQRSRFRRTWDIYIWERGVSQMDFIFSSRDEIWLPFKRLLFGFNRFSEEIEEERWIEW